MLYSPRKVFSQSGIVRKCWLRTKIRAKGNSFHAPRTFKIVTVAMMGRQMGKTTWRSLKYEDIYLKEYATVPQLDAGFADFFRFYNHDRLHQSLAYRTPAEVHFA
jgi:transposase InsO family protein